jgi:nitroreductase
MNTTLNREQLLGRLNWRYATKEFDTQRKISPEDWATLEDALVLTPSSAGLEPWKFIVVTDPAKRQELIGVSYGQRQIVDASHLVVFAAKTNLSTRDVDAYIDRIAKTRGVPVESLSGFRDMVIGGIIQAKNDVARQEWASRQVYIALGNFLNSAAVLGIDACPMEGFDPAKYNEILGLTEKGLSAVVVATAGYRAATDKYAALKKVRSPKNEVVVRV